MSQPKDRFLVPTRTMADDSDEALILRVAAGDQRAFAALSDRHLDRVLATARRVLGDPAEAEDVAQEAFLRLWRNADRYQPGVAAVGTWLYRIVMNLCLDRRRRPATTALDLVEEPPDTREGAEEGLHRRQRDQALALAIAELPDRQRAAVALTYQAGLSNAEAAAALEMGIKGLEALLVRARRSLRSALTPFALGAAGENGATGGAGSTRRRDVG